MELRIAFATSLEECGFGYADAFAELGMTALILGPVHLQFECEMDRTDDLRTSWTAFRAWLATFTLNPIGASPT